MTLECLRSEGLGAGEGDPPGTGHRPPVLEMLEPTPGGGRVSESQEVPRCHRLM